ncbi:MAG: AMP-binding protein [Planctomycetes bacterium]|nr:AMP-binding protein [Planctomycetota bacterium]
MTPLRLSGHWQWDGEYAALSWLREQGADHGRRLLLGVDHTPASAVLVSAALRLGLVVIVAPRRATRDELQRTIAALRPALLVSASAHPLAQCAEMQLAPAHWPGSSAAVGEAWQGSLLVCTSGTTGAPRWVRLDAPQIRAALAAQCAALQLSSDDCWSCPLPLDHIAGLMTALRGLVSGCRVELEPTPSAEATGWSAVPTQLYRVLENGLRPPPHLRLALIGGGPLDPSLAARARAAGWPIAESYGMSEMGGTVAIDGRPLPGIEVRIADDGRIALRGPMCFAGYEDPEGFRLRDGWHVTDDLGSWNAGRLQILGRVSERIITGGEKVDPGEVEAVLRAHPAVAEVCVVGVPDPAWGETVAAALVVRRGAALADIEAYARLHLAGHKRPRRWRLVAELPRNALGKVLRQRVRAWLSDDSAAGDGASSDGHERSSTPADP